MAKTKAASVGPLQLDPAVIMADDNIRFGLLAHRVDHMMESIVERGGVMVPVEVEPLDPAVNGFTHKLTAGFIRHSAALRLNTEQNAGLTIPATVYAPADPLDRLMRQVTENNERENLSPMDKAVAITKLLDAGVSRAEVAKVFAVPGGRKGLAMQPASNSFLNIHLSFLTLPKAIQTKIHDGRLGVAAAMELVKADPADREAILTKAETIRQKAIDREEKAEERETKQLVGEEAKAAKLAAAEAALLTAEEANNTAKAAHEAATQAAKAERAVGPDETRLGLPFADWPEDEKKAKAERVGATKSAVRELDKTVRKTQNARQKAQVELRKLTEPKTEAEPEPVPAKAAAPKKKTAVGPADVKQAKADLGVKGAKPVVLSAADARAAALHLTKSRLAKVSAIGVILGKMLSGELTPARAETELSLVTGERTTKKA